MNKQLWNKILQFDLDDPISEYGFSTRLSNENYWTKNFTREAILEYKKFMYLAATSDLMVSPSEIIDAVWHQHLIFTQSYADFCYLIGKSVQHVPSTHNKEDAEKFRAAKERTTYLYVSAFGSQPPAIWNYTGMYESLHLPKARLKIRSFFLLGIFATALLFVPAFYLLKPLYVTIDNPYFLIGFTVLTIISFLLLELHNRQYLSKVVSHFKSYTFLYDLHSFELVYLKTRKLNNVIYIVIDQLIRQHKIHVDGKDMLQVVTYSNSRYLEEYQTMEVVQGFERTYFPAAMKILLQKPVFTNVANCMDAFKKYFIKSRAFGRLFYLNFAVTAMLFLLLFVRLSTGVLRDKPVTQIAIALTLLFVAIVMYLDRLTTMVCRLTIPTLYERKILPERKISEDSQWQYFLLGNAAFSSVFIPMVTSERVNSGSDSSGGGCGSSCGSSCSSCGGCGGGD